LIVLASGIDRGAQLNNQPETLNPPIPAPWRRPVWADRLLIFIFAALLGMPTLDYFTGIDVTQAPDENRLLAPPPRLARLSLAGVQTCFAGTEAWFNDHFGFRRRLVRWCHQWKYRLYRSGRTVEQVIVGQNGWLYFSEIRMIDHFLGVERMTPQRLESWQRLLEKRRDWLAARGIQYLFVIPPDKQTIYPENLPAWLLAAVPPGRQTKLDQFTQFMREHSTVEILDLREGLTRAKKTAPVYLQNDTHWNWYGGFVGSQEIIKALSRQVPELPPLRLEDFDWTNAPATGGDLARICGTPGKPEKNYFVFTPKPPLIAPQIREATNLIRTRNPYDPTKPNYIVENPGLEGRSVDLVVFHDSYGKALRQFLGYSFHRIVFIWETKEFNARIIAEYHPRIVVNEMLERSLNIEDPEDMMVTDALP
jgi:hypothetical protein